MNEVTVERILARAGHGIGADDQHLLRSMASYLDRNSLKIVGDNGAPGDALELRISNDAERFVVSLPEMRVLWKGLRRGEAVDWSRLRTHAPPP
jgi:hypothetical protein